MIDVSALLCGRLSPSAGHRYGRSAAGPAAPEHQRLPVATSARDRRPVVVWNLTRRCNLRCAHCYTESVPGRAYGGELTTAEAKGVLEDLAAFGVPAVLFSGGEPLLREDLFELIADARNRKLHVVLSTNGTLIDAAAAGRLRDLRCAYVGVSLDSARAEAHDRFRGTPGAFARTMAGFTHLRAAGQKVGLRLTLTRQTAADIEEVFDFIEARSIDRACFYHLVPSGRGGQVEDLTLTESRRCVQTILHRTQDLHDRGRPTEILTVDNHCDGPFIALRMAAAGDPRADEALELLRWNGGARYSSGVGLGNIDPTGEVHADQFWTQHSFGNVRRRPFSQIWMDESDDLMAGLKDRLPRLKGRCGACRFKDLCGGASRVRALAAFGDPWQQDPACYLTDEEIGL
jgi:radical SAM protein with 4Fe4S-binding SPASM domain